MKTDQPQINLFGCSSILLLQVFPNKTRSLSPTFLQKCTKKMFTDLTEKASSAHC